MLYAKKPAQGSQEQRGTGRRKSHYHLFEVKERWICGTSLSRKRQDLALVDPRCVAANAAPTVMGKILPWLLQGRGRPAPGSVKLSMIPLGWERERGEQKAVFCSMSYIWPNYWEPALPAPPSVTAYSCRGERSQLLLLMPNRSQTYPHLCKFHNNFIGRYGQERYYGVFQFMLSQQKHIYICVYS